MELVIIGLNHKSAPVAVREKLAYNKNERTDALQPLNRLPGVAESVILSTCNRTELYIACKEKAFGLEQATAFFATTRHLPADQFAEHLYEHEGSEAVCHLFKVISSIDSMVVGETQILSQVKQAYVEAFEKGSTGKFFNRLFQTAFRVAKKIHTHSTISERKVSVSSVAVEFAERIFEDFSGKTALVVGAGEMSELTLTALRERGIGTTVVANRTYQKAVSLAMNLGARAIRFEAIEDELAKVDIVIASSGAPHFVVSPEQVKRAVRTRKGRPILFIDIALPRDINPEVAEMDNVYVYDLDDLQTVILRNLDARQGEIEKCEHLIEHEVDTFEGVMRLHDVEPLITRLNEQLEGIAQAESKRAISRLGDMTEEQKKEVTYMADRLVRKILHKPLEFLRKDAQAGGDGRYLDAAMQLFDVEENHHEEEGEENG